jgi:hypothetical protein
MNVLRELVQGRYIKGITISICAGAGAGRALMSLNLPNKGRWSSGNCARESETIGTSRSRNLNEGISRSIGFSILVPNCKLPRINAREVELELPYWA